MVTTHARSGIARLVRGSVAAEVVLGTVVPVLVFPPVAMVAEAAVVGRAGDLPPDTRT